MAITITAPHQLQHQRQHLFNIIIIQEVEYLQEDTLPDTHLVTHTRKEVVTHLVDHLLEASHLEVRASVDHLLEASRLEVRTSVDHLEDSHLEAQALEEAREDSQELLLHLNRPLSRNTCESTKIAIIFSIFNPFSSQQLRPCPTTRG